MVHSDDQMGSTLKTAFRVSAVTKQLFERIDNEDNVDIDVDEQ